MSGLLGERKAEAMMSQALSFAREVMNERMGGKSGGGGGGRGGGRGGGNSGGSAPDDKDVIQLTDSNFEDKVLGSDEMWLVEFFAPWCGHCKNLAPEWAKAATQLKGKVHVAAVDATEHRVLASRFGIQGFPTIKFFNSGKKDWDGAEDYTGLCPLFSLSSLVLCIFCLPLKTASIIMNFLFFLKVVVLLILLLLGQWQSGKKSSLLLKCIS